MKIKDVIALLLLLGGFAIGIECAVIMTINRFKNPDMTDKRLMIEYSNVVITGVVACLGALIGLKMIGDS